MAGWQGGDTPYGAATLPPRSEPSAARAILQEQPRGNLASAGASNSTTARGAPVAVQEVRLPRVGECAIPTMAHPHQHPEQGPDRRSVAEAVARLEVRLDRLGENPDTPEESLRCHRLALGHARAALTSVNRNGLVANLRRAASCAPGLLFHLLPRSERDSMSIPRNAVLASQTAELLECGFTRNNTPVPRVAWAASSKTARRHRKSRQEFHDALNMLDAWAASSKTARRHRKSRQKFHDALNMLDALHPHDRAQMLEHMVYLQRLRPLFAPDVPGRHHQRQLVISAEVRARQERATYSPGTRLRRPRRSCPRSRHHRRTARVTRAGPSDDDPPGDPEPALEGAAR